LKLSSAKAVEKLPIWRIDSFVEDFFVSASRQEFWSAWDQRAPADHFFGGALDQFEEAVYGVTQTTNFK